MSNEECEKNIDKVTDFGITVIETIFDTEISDKNNHTQR